MKSFEIKHFTSNELLNVDKLQCHSLHESWK